MFPALSVLISIFYTAILSFWLGPNLVRIHWSTLTSRQMFAVLSYILVVLPGPVLLFIQSFLIQIDGMDITVRRFLWLKAQKYSRSDIAWTNAEALQNVSYLKSGSTPTLGLKFKDGTRLTVFRESTNWKRLRDFLLG